MPDYCITFVGHIDIHKRPDGFPHEVKEMIFINADSREGVVKAVNEHTSAYLRIQGMAVSLNPTELQDAKALPQHRAWVPMHMITHLTAEVQMMIPNIQAISEGNMNLAAIADEEPKATIQ
jgi:hypothetical protein